MSELRVDSVKSKGGGAPDLPKGVTISGIATAVTLGATQIDVSNVNVSGVVTSGTLSGDLLSTGTPTLGLGVTINSSGLVISGVATAGIVSATTLYGDGSNLTGVGATLAPLFYNPDASDGGLELTATGIGITFNQQIKAGTGNVTLRLVGAAGTVVENFGVGSSVTISENRVSFTPTADLSVDTVYHLSYPSGCFTNNEGTDYVGTAYTFNTRELYNQLFGWGNTNDGRLGINIASGHRSSPTQVPGNTWRSLSVGGAEAGGIGFSLATKTDGTLWSWGSNAYGSLGLNQAVPTKISSPTQIPGTTWGTYAARGPSRGAAIKTDGTLWAWGSNTAGELGQNNVTAYSSPIQIPGTTWSSIEFGERNFLATKTDGTLWSCGYNNRGALGQNNNIRYSSPVQIPGTNWSTCSVSKYHCLATRTDGTLWSWGIGFYGATGVNKNEDAARFSSPTQIPGTTWASCKAGAQASMATRTDGTAWAWGLNTSGRLGQNNLTKYSSPVQIPGTTWSTTQGDMWNSDDAGAGSLKTDGTLWIWGNSSGGELAQNNTTPVSSPIQIPGTWIAFTGGPYFRQGIKQG